MITQQIEPGDTVEWDVSIVVPGQGTKPGKQEGLVTAVRERAITVMYRCDDAWVSADLERPSVHVRLARKDVLNIGRQS